MSTKPRSLVTGCAGFIGSHVAETLLATGHEVVGLDDLSGGTRAQVPGGVRFVEGSVDDEPLVRSLFTERIDFVFHLAAYAAEGLSHFVRRFNYQNNVVGSVTLINGAVNAGTVRCFVFTSSIAVYGRAVPPVTEDMALQPIDPYGIAKLAVELDLRAAHETFGLNYVIFRPHNVYGERQNLADPYRNVIGIFMNQSLDGRAMTVFGDGRQSRAFTYVGDVAPVIAAVVNRPQCYNQTFNIGADDVCSVIDVAHLVAASLNVPPAVRHLAPRQEVEHTFAAHDALRHRFGDLGPRTSLPAGLARMAAWARSETRVKRTAAPAPEIVTGLPSAWRRARE